MCTSIRWLLRVICKFEIDLFVLSQPAPVMGLRAITATASIKVGSVMAIVIVEMGKMKAIAQQVSMASA